MSCCPPDSDSRRPAWQWSAGVICLVTAILLYFVHLPPEWKAQTWVDFAEGLLFGVSIGLFLIALVNSRKRD